jgi:hypothetical protein
MIPMGQATPTTKRTRVIAGEYPAGNGQVVVAYVGADTGGEVDPAALAEEIAADAARRGASAMRIVAMAGVPLRHSAVAFGREGSGFTTKSAVVVTSGPASH